MDIEEQEQKFDQSLDQMSHSTTRLTNIRWCHGHVTERSPRLYLKTKLHLLSCISGLSKAVVKVQQARNELSFFRQNVGLASTEELCSALLAKDKKEKKKVARERFRRAAPTAERGRKKTPAPIREWNTLPATIVEADSLARFQSGLRDYLDSD